MLTSKNHFKTGLVGIVLSAVTALPAFASDIFEDGYYRIRSVDRQLNTRKVCMTLDDKRYRFKTCDDRQSQRFQLISEAPYPGSGSQHAYLIKQGSKCLSATDTDHEEAKIRYVRCSGDSWQEVIKSLDNNPPKQLVWSINIAIELLSTKTQTTDGLCLTDGNRKDDIKATGCTRRHNPGRWSVETW